MKDIHYLGGAKWGGPGSGDGAAQVDTHCFLPLVIATLTATIRLLSALYQN